MNDRRRFSFWRWFGTIWSGHQVLIVGTLIVVLTLSAMPGPTGVVAYGIFVVAAYLLRRHHRGQMGRQSQSGLPGFLVRAAGLVTVGHEMGCCSAWASAVPSGRKWASGVALLDPHRRAGP